MLQIQIQLFSLICQRFRARTPGSQGKKYDLVICALLNLKSESVFDPNLKKLQAIRNDADKSRRLSFSLQTKK